MKEINFKNNNRFWAGSLYFFGRDAKGRLSRSARNMYTTDMPAKECEINQTDPRVPRNYIFVAPFIEKSAPDFCYMQVHKAEKKKYTYMVTEADLITPQHIDGHILTQEMRESLISRPDNAIKDTIKWYNVLSKNGDIPMIVVAYKMKTDFESHTHTNASDNPIFFDCFLFNGRTISIVEAPCDGFEYLLRTNDYSKAYFKDFKEI